MKFVKIKKTKMIIYIVMFIYMKMRK